MGKYIIAVDGPSLNEGLERNVGLDPNGKVRIRLDYQRLKNFLSYNEPKTQIRYYVSRVVLSENDIAELEEKVRNDDPTNPFSSRERGKVIRFGGPHSTEREKGWGFIRNVKDGESYFVHHSDIDIHGFRCLEENEMVSFDVGEGVRGGKAAKKVRPTRLLPQMRNLLKRQKFFSHLRRAEYEVVQCRPSQVMRKNKSVDIQIILDTFKAFMDEEDDDDFFVLCSDDVHFVPFLRELQDMGVEVAVAAFGDMLPRELREVVEDPDNIWLLDKFVDDLIVDGSDEYIDEEDGEPEEQAPPTRKKPSSPIYLPASATSEVIAKP